MENRSKLSVQREKTRTSPEMARFKEQIIEFLLSTNADRVIFYLAI